VKVIALGLRPLSGLRRCTCRTKGLIGRVKLRQYRK
jgi:hypothetical protein